eukprot:jgi/Chlat1/670/Chrsp104S01155
MPTLNITTNVPSDSVSTSDFLKAASKIIAAETGKPESYVCVSLRAGVPMTFGGTEEPAAAAELISIGGIGGQKNKSISKKLSDLLSASLNVAPNRYYINFVDMERNDVGWNGGTFA